MKILFISDVHFGHDVNYPDIKGTEYINTFGTQFPRLLSQLVPEAKNYDLFVTVGDAIADENPEKDAETYKTFLHYFNSFTLPIKHVIGNHDARWLTREQLSGLAHQPNNYFSFDLADHHHLILDAKYDGYPFTMDDAQISWLKHDLAETKLPTVVYLHYPCDKQDISRNYYFNNQEEKVFVKQRDELRALFEASKKVRLVMSGHTHFFHESVIKGITYVTVPSFTENDGTGKPGGLFVIASLESDEPIKIEMKHV